MITGTLKNGFSYKVEDSAINNMELIDAIAEMDVNPLAISGVVKLLLGDKQKKALYDHLRAEAGNVPIDAISAAVVEIFNSNQQTKN